MHHPLADERLAALADSAPTAEESAHLSECATCAGEVRAYRALLALARAERGLLMAPLTHWKAIAGAVRAEPATHARRWAWRYATWPRAAAAAIVALAAGIALGRFTARAPGQIIAAISPSPAPTQFATNAVATNAVAHAVNADSAPVFQSSADAIEALARAERQYRRAEAYLVGTQSPARVETVTETYRLARY